jgi:hypothetical protein
VVYALKLIEKARNTLRGRVPAAGTRAIRPGAPRPGERSRRRPGAVLAAMALCLTSISMISLAGASAAPRANAARSTAGYWLTSSSGGVFNFGGAPFGQASSQAHRE